jgi:hypothetical protein
MKKIGFLLLIAGFLAAAYSTALDVVATDWTLYVPAALVAALGVLMLKRAANSQAKSASVLTANRTELAESLQNIVTSLEYLQAEGASVIVEKLRHEIDSRLRDDLRRFADARESLVHLYGLQTYADLMSNFATGERYINRVWSASADGYDVEARDYLDRATNQFRDARQQLQAAGS